MESFTFYRFEKVSVWTKDTYNVDATSKDEAQKLLLSSIEDGNDYKFVEDYEVLLDTMWEESPSVSIIQDENDNEIERTEK